MRKANICLTNEQHSSFRKLLRCLLLLIDMRNGSPKKLRSGKCIFFFYFNSTVLSMLISICNFDLAKLEIYIESNLAILGDMGDIKLQFWMFWILIFGGNSTLESAKDSPIFIFWHSDFTGNQIWKFQRARNCNFGLIL